MKKDISKRLVYYTRKVAERYSHNRKKALQPNFKLRNERLLKYKEMMMVMYND